MPKRLVIGLAAAALCVLTVAGAAVAFGGGEETNDELLANVAEQLGLDPETVVGAFRQAKREQIDARFVETLDDLVEHDRITQEEADEAVVWFENRPESASKLPKAGIGAWLNLERTHVCIAPDLLSDEDGRFAIPGDIRQRMAELLGIDETTLDEAFESARSVSVLNAKKSALKDMVERLVDSGDLTASEGDGLKSWIDEMPEFLADLSVAKRLLAGFVGTGPEIRVFPDLVPEGLDGTRFQGIPERFEFRFQPFPGGPVETWHPERGGGATAIWGGT